MRSFLANENVPAEAVLAARAVGYEIKWVAELASGSSDDQVLAIASEGGHVLLTFDKDFGEMVFRRGKSGSCGVILFRPRMLSSQYLAQFVVSVLNQKLSWEGRFAVAQEGNLRMIELRE